MQDLKKTVGPVSALSDLFQFLPHAEILANGSLLQEIQWNRRVPLIVTGGQTLTADRVSFITRGGAILTPQALFLEIRGDHLGEMGLSDIASQITISSSHRIFGHIVNAAGTNLSAVSLTLIGSVVKTVQTDVNGNFDFGQLTVAGSYLLRPSRGGSVFLPATATILLLAADVEIPFTAASATSPKLNIVRNGADIVLSWEAAPGFTLESAPDLSNSASWQPMAPAPLQNTYRCLLNESVRFYRLRL